MMGMKFRHLSIEHKLNLVVFLAITSAMALSSSLMIGRYANASRQQHVEDLATLADIIGNNSKAALSFQDPDDALEILTALSHKPVILSALLYDRDQQPFARFDRGVTSVGDYPELPETDAPFVRDQVLWKASPIFQNSERIGTLILQADLHPLHVSIQRQILFAVLITVGSVALAMLLASRIQHFILRHIRRVVDMAKAVAIGDLPEPLRITSEDEVGELQEAFNRIVEATRSVVRQTQTLAKGHYAISIEPRSDRDELSHALIKMTRALNTFNEDSRRQDWLKNSISDLNDRIRGERGVDDLLGNVLAWVTVHLDANAALFFLREDAQTLRLAAAHAIDPEQVGEAVVTIGKGLVGQVAADRRLLMIADPGGRPLVLRSGLLDHALRHLALVPLLHDESLAGVMEIGRLAAFTPEHQELLRTAGPAVAIAVEAARSRHILNELLAETQRQSRELQQQQGALQESNRELEARNELLENQKQEIHRQNDALEAARLDLERKARELAQASKYKSEFLANMSHELRTPLNSMLILSRLLADNKDGNLTAKQVDFARTINKSGSDLLALINDILDLSKVEAGMLEFHPEEIAVDDIVNAIQPLFKPLAVEKGIGFIVSREAGIPARIVTDGKRVGQILRNIIGNAFKFTPEGAVTLRIWKPAADDAAHGGAAIAFSVIDTGIGIPPDKHDLIFRAFQQADGTTTRQYGGTGLGLSISREFAIRLGGDIALESQPGEGSTFTLYLPEKSALCAAPTAPKPAPGTPPVPEKPVPTTTASTGPLETGPKLLVIEDDGAFARIVADLATQRGYKVLVAVNGEQGIQFARTHHPDGILLDMMLPGRDGHSVLRALKEDAETRCIPVFILSALEHDQQLIREGAIGFGTKPVTPDQIQQAIDRIEWVGRRNPKTLLVVDDNQDTAKVLAAVLEGWPVNMLYCASGKEAIETARASELDGILLDWGLLDMSGREVLDALEPFPPGSYIPVILYTGRSIERDEEAVLRKRLVSVVVKGDQAPSRLADKIAFYLHLKPPKKTEPPVQTTTRPAVAEPTRPKPDGVIERRKILIVDDDMRNAFSLSAIIDGWGGAALVATDGQKALDMLADDPGIDLVLMDIMMPGMDGYEAMREIRKRPALKHLPVIALTAKAMREDRLACMEAGANDYLAKPVDIDQLNLLVKSWIRRSA